MPEPTTATPTPAPAAASSAPGAIDWGAGAALGLLLGLLVGLSASPVVSSVVTGLVALLAAMFGLSDKLPLGLSRAGAHRLTAFALAAAAAVLLGLQLRTHWLAPDVAELKRQLAEIGITEPAEQKAMLRYLRFGLAPDGSKPGEAPKALQSVLYNGQPDFCPNLRRLLDDKAAPADVLLHLGSGNEAARRAAAGVQALPEAQRAAALQAAPAFLCAP